LPHVQLVAFVFVVDVDPMALRADEVS